jgi:hypothetical protein
MLLIGQVTKQENLISYQPKKGICQSINNMSISSDLQYFYIGSVVQSRVEKIKNNNSTITSLLEFHSVTTGLSITFQIELSCVPK